MKKIKICGHKKYGILRKKNNKFMQFPQYA